MVADKARESEEIASAGTADPSLRPVFVYSGFRASSTWFWTKLRADPRAVAYYEPFHEAHSTLSLDNVMAQRPGAWRSHHPDSAAYMLEYVSLLGETPGIPGFPIETDVGEKLIGQRGIDGPLDADVAAYVATLIRAAQEQGRIPVLADSRLMGRSSGFRQAFGGTHILLIRNLFHQWNSYLGQASSGNFFFLETLFNTLKLAQRDEYIGYLSKIFPSHKLESFQSWVMPDNLDKAFCYFTGIHLYFLLKTRRNADLIIDANALARQPSAYQQEVAGKIHALTGLVVDVSDAQESVDYPLHAIEAPDDCRALIRGFADRLAHVVQADAQEVAFIDNLISSLWDERDRFNVYTRSVAEHLQAQQADLDAAQRAAAEAADARSALAGKDRTIDDLRNALAIERHSTEQLAHAHEQSLQSLARADERIAELIADATPLREHVDTMTSRLRQRDEEISQAWAQLEATRGEAGSLEAQTADLNTKLETISGRLEAADAWVFTLAAQRTRNEVALARAQAALARAERDRDSAQAALRRQAEQNQTIAGLGASLAAARADAARARVELDDVRDELRAMGETRMACERAELKVAALEQQLEASTALTEDIAARHRAHIDAVRAERADLAATVNAQEQTIAAMQADVTSKIQAHRELSRERNRLAAEAGQAVATATHTRDQAEWLRLLAIEFRHRRWWWSLLPAAYVETLRRRRLSRLGLFDSDAYLGRYHDVANSGMSPVEHYLRHGIEEGREPAQGRQAP